MSIYNNFARNFAGLAEFIEDHLEKYHDEPFFPALFLEYDSDNINYQFNNCSVLGYELYMADSDVSIALLDAKDARARGLKSSDKKFEAYLRKKEKLEALVERCRDTEFLEYFEFLIIQKEVACAGGIERYCDEPFFPVLFLQYAPDNIDCSALNLSEQGLELYNADYDVYTAIDDAIDAYCGGLKSSEQKIQSYYKKKAKLEALVEQYRHTKFLTIKKKTEEV